MKTFSHEVAAITGAGSGIGQALALQLAQQGCNLALSDISEDGLIATQALLKDYPVTVTSKVLNVADETAVYEWASEVKQQHSKVSMIFNNAGVALSGTVDSLSNDDFRWIMDINFYGVLYGTKAFLPLLEESGRGHIINISSIFGLASQPFMSGYNASKFAVRGLTESLRQDLELTGSKVSTTCVHPGGIKTNIAKSARMSDSVEKVTGADQATAVAEFERMFINTPEKAARTILNGVRKNKRRVLIGPDARLFDLIVRLLPTGYQWLFTKAVSLQKR